MFLQLSRKIPSMDERIWNFFIVPLLWISCFRKTKEKQCEKYDWNACIAGRLIWQLVIHSCVIFVIFLISIGVPLLPPPSREVLRPNSLPLPFRTPATQATSRRTAWSQVTLRAIERKKFLQNLRGRGSGGWVNRVYFGGLCVPRPDRVQ